jgi:hypothetical protein
LRNRASGQPEVDNLQAAVETYLTDMHRRHATGATTAETSYYGPLENLLNTVGASLKPKVLCVGQLGSIGRRSARFRPVHS